MFHENFGEGEHEKWWPEKDPWWVEKEKKEKKQEEEAKAEEQRRKEEAKTPEDRTREEMQKVKETMERRLQCLEDWIESFAGVLGDNEKEKEQIAYGFRHLETQDMPVEYLHSWQEEGLKHGREVSKIDCLIRYYFHGGYGEIIDTAARAFIKKYEEIREGGRKKMLGLQEKI